MTFYFNLTIDISYSDSHIKYVFSYMIHPLSIYNLENANLCVITHNTHKQKVVFNLIWVLIWIYQCKSCFFFFSCLTKFREGDQSKSQTQSGKTSKIKVLAEKFIFTSFKKNEWKVQTYIQDVRSSLDLIIFHSKWNRHSEV